MPAVPDRQVTLPGLDSTTSTIATSTCRSWRRGWATAASPVRLTSAWPAQLPDIPNYTDLTPVIQISEVVVAW